MPLASPFSSLTDDALIIEAVNIARDERHALVALLRVVVEVDLRKLYLREGYASLFAWCTRALGLEDGAAYNRIEVARVAQRLPAVLDEMERGRVSLSAIRLLAPHLTADNCSTILERAAGLSKREVQLLVVELSPRRDVANAVRRLTTVPARAQACDVLVPRPEYRGTHSVPNDADRPVTADTMRPQVTLDTHGRTFVVDDPTRPTDTPAEFDAEQQQVAQATFDPDNRVVDGTIPLSPTRFRLHVTISSETHARLRLAQDLLRHAIPDGDLAEILDRALALLVSQLERRRFAGTPGAHVPHTSVSRGTVSSRHIPAHVRRAVWKRDGGRCAFIGRRGRCRERAFLEFHHAKPFAVGGLATVENLSLRCRAHNAFEAAVYFGNGSSRAPTETPTTDNPSPLRLAGAPDADRPGRASPHTPRADTGSTGLP